MKSFSQTFDFEGRFFGVKVIKSKAKEFFYRRYAGFNTLVVRV